MDGFSQVSIRGSDKTDSFLVQPNLVEKEFSFESGQTHYLERIFDREYNVASPSFFQVNTTQAENLGMIGSTPAGYTTAIYAVRANLTMNYYH